MFRSLVDRIGLGSLVPVEYFGNKNCEFLPDKKLLQRFEVRDFFIYFFNLKHLLLFKSGLQLYICAIVFVILHIW